MIIWLASYPRSGNTLLRTILNKSMGLGSYSDELVRPVVGLSDDLKREFGHEPIEGPWEAFYERATAGEATFLVKTHLPPRDAQPAMYVVRDGRRSVVSYHQYHRRYLGEHALTLLGLVLGLDYYGGWSGHYRRWAASKGRRLTLRYEDLVDASDSMLEAIAEFIGHKGPISSWSNPFDDLRVRNPGFFREGKVAWEPAPAWSDLLDQVFFLLHGDLMAELGYEERGAVEAVRALLGPEIAELARTVESLSREKVLLERVCDERASVIQKLDSEVNSLRGVCGERLGLINALDAEIKRLSTSGKSW